MSFVHRHRHLDGHHADVERHHHHMHPLLQQSYQPQHLCWGWYWWACPHRWQRTNYARFAGGCYRLLSPSVKAQKRAFVGKNFVQAETWYMGSVWHQDALITSPH